VSRQNDHSGYFTLDRPRQTRRATICHEVSRASTYVFTLFFLAIALHKGLVDSVLSGVGYLVLCWVLGIVLRIVLHLATADLQYRWIRNG